MNKKLVSHESFMNYIYDKDICVNSISTKRQEFKTRQGKLVGFINKLAWNKYEHFLMY